MQSEDARRSVENEVGAAKGKFGKGGGVGGRGQGDPRELVCVCLCACALLRLACVCTINGLQVIEVIRFVRLQGERDGVQSLGLQDARP